MLGETLKEFFQRTTDYWSEPHPPQISSCEAIQIRCSKAGYCGLVFEKARHSRTSSSALLTTGQNPTPSNFILRSYSNQMLLKKFFQRTTDYWSEPQPDDLYQLI
jgi:hypothetical protein